MKTKIQFLLPILMLIFMASCDKTEYPSLSFYTDYLEVPIHGTALVFPKTGSGNYTLEAGNPLLLRAEMESGWHNPLGTIAKLFTKSAMEKPTPTRWKLNKHTAKKSAGNLPEKSSMSHTKLVDP